MCRSMFNNSNRSKPCKYTGEATNLICSTSNWTTGGSPLKGNSHLSSVVLIRIHRSISPESSWLPLSAMGQGFDYPSCGRAVWFPDTRGPNYQSFQTLAPLVNPLEHYALHKNLSSSHPPWMRQVLLSAAPSPSVTGTKPLASCAMQRLLSSSFGRRAGRWERMGAVLPMPGQHRNS
jgi:hypothetical protein